MIEAEEPFAELLNQFEYASHWVSLGSLLSKCTPKKPFLKLRQFDESKFTRKHETTINHLYFQKLYLICLAIEYNAKLELSEKYYIDNGLVFMVYDLSLKDSPPRRMAGLAMKEEVYAEMGHLGFVDIIKENSDIFFQYIHNLKSHPKEEYVQWSSGVTQIIEFNSEIKPMQFIQQFEKLPLAEHYVFNVRLRNAILLPSLLSDREISERYLSMIKMQRGQIEEYLGGGEAQELMQKMEAVMKEIYSTLQSKGRISQLSLNYVQPSKGKSKQVNELKIESRFLINLCPSRATTEANETTGENPDQKDKAQVKSQSKPPNGPQASVSGNLINVSLSWDFYLDSKSYRLKVECFSNRKLEEMFYDELLDFWHRLEGCEQFRDMVGVDKYLMLLSDKKTKEMVLTNYVPGCLPTQSVKEVDKLVSLLVALDEAMEICERKGFEYEDPANFQIMPYMVKHARERFQLALGLVEKNYNSLLGQNREMGDD